MVSRSLIKPKKRLCCMMRPLGECRYCDKVVCASHGRGIYEDVSSILPGRVPVLLDVQCLSTKCNDAVHRDLLAAARRRDQRRSLRVSAGLLPYPVNSAGKALLDRITSQNDKRSISKISYRKGRKH